jgi:hypothetical protein
MFRESCVPCVTKRPKEWYQLWKEGATFTFFRKDNESARERLQSDATFVWECQASTWKAAQQMMLDHLSCTPFKTRRRRSHAADTSNTSV